MRHPHKKLPHHPRAGFTLVELIVTIAVFAVVGGVAIGFFVSTVTGRAKAQARIDAQSHARLAIERVTYELRRARGLEATSDYGVNLATTGSATLDLDMTNAANDPTTISVSGGVVYLKQGSGSAVALTSDDIEVTNLTVTNESSANGRSKAVKIELTAFHPDPTGQGDLDIEYTLRTSVDLRGK